MNFAQIIFTLFALISAAISIAGIVAVARSPKTRVKPLWLIGCLFGFMGIGVNWTNPDDLILLFGMQIPVVQIFKILPDGPVIGKSLFPFIAMIVLSRKWNPTK